MKRSEMIQKIVETMGFRIGLSQSYEVAEDILKFVEETGMLPPTNTCRLIPDTVRGGMKHSPTERKWDEETENG